MYRKHLMLALQSKTIYSFLFAISQNLAGRIIMMRPKHFGSIRQLPE